MNTSLYIAKRYLFSKKSVNAINFISGISMLGVFVGSAALIIILSVFNGFETLILSMYDTFTPEIRIEPASGKTFNPNTAYLTSLKKDSRVANFSEVLEEKALLRYGDAQYIGLVKGVSDNFFKTKQLDSVVLQGYALVKSEGQEFAVIGSSVQNYLSVNIKDQFRDIEIYSPKKGSQNSINPAEEFTIQTIHPVGVFEAQQQFNDMVIVPINFARTLLNEEKNLTVIELNFITGTDILNVQKEIVKNLGKNFVVKNRSQQNANLYKILHTEKWAIYLILTFVLIIAIFNIIGSLTMLVIDKQKDIAILSSLGAGKNLIRGIFFIEGMMISMIGCIVGMAVGLGFCLVQQHFGLIRMGGENLITKYYPVTLKATDSLLVFSTVIIVSLLASSISSRLSVKDISLKGDL